MKKRTHERFELREFLSDDDILPVYLELEIPDKVKALVDNISLKGFCIEMDSLSEEQVACLREQERFFVKIYIRENLIIAGVTIAWDSVTDKSTGIFYRAGLSISIISPEDNLILSSFIEKIRLKK